MRKRIGDPPILPIEGWTSVFTPSRKPRFCLLFKSKDLSRFTPTTPAYDVEFWTEAFIQTYFLSGLEQQPPFDAHGKPISAKQFQQKIKNIWQYLPPDMRYVIETLS